MGEFSQKKNRVGERGVANNGLSMEIIAYRTNKDIDVMFEDGTVVTHKTYTYFRTGRIPYPDFYKKQRLGETGLYNDLQMEIIEYRNASDIDIRFSNGYILKHTGYTNFTRKAFPFVVSHYHEKKIASNGMMAEIIECRSSKDIDIQFEDGTIREHTRTSSFYQGRVAPIQINYSEKYVGQTRTMNCGIKATIIAYRNRCDMDIKFENGIVREHVKMSCFQKGQIGPIPRDKKMYYIGQTRTMSCGMKATIITYRGCDDIDVQFEDGSINKHKRTDAFQMGKIAHTSNHTKADYLGKTHTMKSGIKATIIKYRNVNDIDVQFEDNTIRKHMAIRNFNRGIIAHPNKNIIFGTYKISKIAFQFHDKTYFYVTYTENNSEISEVMCIDDMKQKLPELA